MSKNILMFKHTYLSFNNVNVDIFVLQPQPPHATLKAVTYEQSMV